jgi:hypothetical protein
MPYLSFPDVSTLSSKLIELIPFRLCRNTYSLYEHIHEKIKTDSYGAILLRYMLYLSFPDVSTLSSIELIPFRRLCYMSGVQYVNQKEYINKGID